MSTQALRRDRSSLGRGLLDRRSGTTPVGEEETAGHSRRDGSSGWRLFLGGTVQRGIPPGNARAAAPRKRRRLSPAHRESSVCGNWRAARRVRNSRTSAATSRRVIEPAATIRSLATKTLSSRPPGSAVTGPLIAKSNNPSMNECWRRMATGQRARKNPLADRCEHPECERSRTPDRATFRITVNGHSRYPTPSSLASRFSDRSASTGSPRSQRVN
jgi:hypothetical protein